MNPIMILIEWLKELGYIPCSYKNSKDPIWEYKCLDSKKHKNQMINLDDLKEACGTQQLYVSIINQNNEALCISYYNNNYVTDIMGISGISTQFYPLVDPNIFNRLKNDLNL